VGQQQPLLLLLQPPLLRLPLPLLAAASAAEPPAAAASAPQQMLVTAAFRSPHAVQAQPTVSAPLLLALAALSLHALQQALLAAAAPQSVLAFVVALTDQPTPC
jgi:hypothetical protein